MVADKIIVYLMDSNSGSGVNSVPITNYVSSTIPSTLWKNIATYTETHSDIDPASKLTIVNGMNLTLEDISKFDSPESSKVIIWGRPSEHQKIQTHFTAKRVVPSPINSASSHPDQFLVSNQILLLSDVHHHHLRDPDVDL